MTMIAPVLVSAVGGAIYVFAKVKCLHRPIRLVAEVLFRRTGSMPQRSAEPQNAVWIRFPAAQPRSLDDRWMKDFKEAVFEPEVHHLILKQNAITAVGLSPGT
jgi:hypothetical protein